MSDVTVTVNFKFTIPYSEIADFNDRDLIDFVISEIKGTDAPAQFKFYDLSEFKPVITDIFRNKKKIK